MNFHLPHMPKSILKFFKDILTGIDNNTFDVARATWFFGALFFMGVTVYQIHHFGKPISYRDWAIAFGTLMGAGAGAVKWKASCEPAPPAQNTNE